MYDEDNSGSIALDEMEKVCNCIKLNKTETIVQVMDCIYNMFEGMGQRPSGDPKERAGRIFRKIDINGDGDLTENEFIKGCSDDKEMMELLNKLFASLTGER